MTKQTTWHRLVADAPVPAWVADPDLARFAVNDAWRVLTGGKLPEFDAATRFDCIEPGDRDHVREAQNAGGWEVHYRLRTLSGAIEFVTETAHPVTGDDGAAPIAFVGWISRLAGVRAERDRLAAIIGASTDAIFSVLDDGLIVSWNRAAATLYGWEHQDIIGRSSHTLCPEDRCDEMDGLFAARADGHAAAPFESTGLHKDGHTFDALLSPSPFETSDMRGVVVIAHDISDEKRAAHELRIVRQEVADLNQQLRQRLADLETLLEVVPVGIGIANDATCQDIRVNPAMARMLRVPAASNASKSSSDAPELPFRVFRGGEEVPAEQLPMQVAAATGEILSGEEFTIRFEDGTAVQLLEFAAPLRDERNEPRGSVGVFIDVTERRAAEEALLKANAIKDEFLALVSHELRTPMAVVLGLARLLKRRGDSLDALSRAEALEQLQSDAERLASLIENMLLLSRIDYEQGVELEPISITQMLRRLAAEHQAKHNRPVILELPPAGVPVVEGNEMWIEQIVVNLLNNGEKYSPRPHPITVRATGSDGDPWVRVVISTVADQLEDADLSQFFEPFVRADRTRTKPGLGVGLTVCRRLVETQGGEITASLPGDGTLEIAFTLRGIAAVE